VKRFIAIFLTFSTSVFLLLGFRLTGIGGFSWLVAGMSFFMVLSYMLFLRSRLLRRIDKYYREIVFFIVGCVSFTIGLIVFRDFIFLPLSYLENPDIHSIVAFIYSTRGTLLLLSATFLLFAFGFWNASRGPRISRVLVPISNLPAEFEDFSIVQISDLHIGAGIDEKFVQNVVNMTLGLKPSAIVLTGDIADGNFKTFCSVAAPLGLLCSNSPVFFVTGNHEYYNGWEEWIEYFRQLNMKVLLNQHAVLTFQNRSVLFAGVIDPAAGIVNPKWRPSLQEALASAPSCDLKVLLAHQPGIADEAAPYFDLQISGHTHGGQFFPWTLIIGFFHNYAVGLMRAGSMWVYVNVGSGYWGPRLRLGTRSEISVLRFKRL
jgi:uncharacterized protein